MSYRDIRSEVLLQRVRTAAEAFRRGRRHERRNVEVVVTPESMAQFGLGNSDLPPAAVVRQLLDAAGFDENRLFDYRFDHKLAHNLVARELANLPMPRSEGLAAFTHGVSDAYEVESRLRREFPHGYVIKPTLGAGSGDEESFDVTAQVLASLSEVPDEELDPYIIQERLSIAREYRIHTVEDLVLDELILPRYDTESIDAATRHRLAAFTRDCLASMPDALVYDAVCGWDVADTMAGLVVIEINYTGFHPVWHRGYQTSGFLQEPLDGPHHLATWLRWMRRTYGVAVSLAAADAGWQDPQWAEELARLVRQ